MTQYDSLWLIVAQYVLLWIMWLIVTHCVSLRLNMAYYGLLWFVVTHVVYWGSLWLIVT